jgi:hypothetical protein
VLLLSVMQSCLHLLPREYIGATGAFNTFLEK